MGRRSAKCTKCGAENEVKRSRGFIYVVQGKCNKCGAKFTTTNYWEEEE